MSYHPTQQHGNTNFCNECLLEWLKEKWIAAKMYGMFIINGVCGPEAKSSGGKTSSNPQVWALIPRPASIGMETMRRRPGIYQNSHPPNLVHELLRNQFIHYHISNRWVFGYIYWISLYLWLQATRQFIFSISTIIWPIRPECFFFLLESTIE